MQKNNIFFRRKPASKPLNIEPFIINFSPCSSAANTPISEVSVCYSPKVQPSPMEKLLAEYRYSIEEHLPRLEQSARESAVTGYLFSNAVTAKDVEHLVPEFNIYPFTLMNKLVTNIGLFRSRGDITDSELEKMYVHLVAQGSNQINVIFEKICDSVERFKKNSKQQGWKPRAYASNGVSEAYRRSQAAHSVSRSAVEQVCYWQTSQPSENEKVDEVWHRNVSKAKAVVKIAPRVVGEVPTRNFPTNEDVLTSHSVEKENRWNRNKVPTRILFQEDRSKTPVVHLPLTEHHPWSTSIQYTSRAVQPALPLLSQKMQAGNHG